MKTRIIILAAFMLGISLSTYAQEEAIQKLAETEHQKFAKELPNSFKKGDIKLFGLAKAEKKQFFLEESQKAYTDFLGWDKKLYAKRNISTVFKALSVNTKASKKNPNPVSVTFNFPAQPSEFVNISVKKPKSPPKRGKDYVVDYSVTTKADVTVEISKKGLDNSVASNTVSLVWVGRLNMLNGEVHPKKKNAPPVLRSINVEPIVVPSVPKEEVMRARAKELIEAYYQNLQSSANRSAALAPEITSKEEFSKWLQNSTKIVVEGSVNVQLPDASSQKLVVRNIPGVKIYLDPAPYLTDDVSQYRTTDTYHQLTMAITVDFKADEITKVEFEDRFVTPVLAPKPEVKVELPPPPPVVKGQQYKVQILLLDSYKAIDQLPNRYRVDNLVVEKYSDGYCKYVIPASSLKEALAIRSQMISKGVEDAWIAVYEDGVRVRPSQGKPDVVR